MSRTNKKWSASEEAKLLKFVTKNESTLGRIEAINTVAKELDHPQASVKNRFYELSGVKKRPYIRRTTEPRKNNPVIDIQRYPTAQAVSKVVQKRNGDIITYYHKR